MHSLERILVLESLWFMQSFVVFVQNNILSTEGSFTDIIITLTAVRFQEKSKMNFCVL